MRSINRLIALMNGVNVELKDLLVVVALEVEKLSLRLGCLGVLALWNVQAVELGDYLDRCKGQERPPPLAQ